MNVLAHIRKHDHWTFLVGLALVMANVRFEDRRVSATAICFFLAALGYDAYEYLLDEKTTE